MNVKTDMSSSPKGKETVSLNQFQNPSISKDNIFQQKMI